MEPLGHACFFSHYVHKEVEDKGMHDITGSETLKNKHLKFKIMQKKLNWKSCCSFCLGGGTLQWWYKKRL